MTTPAAMPFVCALMLALIFSSGAPPLPMTFFVMLTNSCELT